MIIECKPPRAPGHHRNTGCDLMINNTSNAPEASDVANAILDEQMRSCYPVKPLRAIL
jgi:hypothetical protein